jgi:hypothetical protein
MPIFSDQNEKDLYVQGVWEKVQSKYLQVYPFLTDHEFRELFGEKLLNILAALNCPQENCGLCDTDIDCPFYSAKLDRCGIDPYKPVHCRLWHCYECGPRQIVKELRELTGIFADQMGSEMRARKIKSALERGEVSAGAARKRFEKLIEEFRTKNRTFQ